MTKLIRRCFIGLGIVFGLLSLLLVGAYLYLQTGHAQHFIQGKIRAQIPGTISWETFRLSPLQGLFVFQNLSLKDPSGEVLVHIDRASVNIAWVTLLKGDLTVAELILEKPTAALQVNKRGEFNLMAALTPQEHGDPMGKEGSKKRKGVGIPIRITFKSLKFVQGTISYEMVSPQAIVVTEEVDFTAEGNLLSRVAKVTLHIGRGRIESRELRTDLIQCTIDGMVRQDRIDSFVFEAYTASSKLKASGSIDHIFGTPVFDLSLEAALALPELRKALALEPALTGDLTVQLTARGSLDNPEVDLSFDWGGALVRGHRIDRINADLSLRNRLLTLKNMRINVASGDLRLRGDIDLHKAFTEGLLASKRDLEAISYKLFLETQGIRLDQFFGVAHRKWTGTVNSTLFLSGRGISPRTLSADVVLELAAQGLTADQFPRPVDVRMKTEVSLTEGSATFKGLEATWGDFMVRSEGRFDLFSQAITAEVTAGAPNVNETLSSLGLQGVSGKCEIKGDISGSLINPLFDFSLQGTGLRFKDITAGNVWLSASLDPSGSFKISRLTLENRGALVQGHGSVKVFSDAPFKLEPEPDFSFSAVLKDIDLKDFASKERARGTLEGEVALTGTLKAIEAAGSLRGKNLSMQAFRLGDAEAELRFSQGNVSLDRLQIHNGNSLLRGSGAAHVLEKSTLQPHPDPPFTLDIQGDTLFVEDFVDALKGKLSLKARIEGSMKRPKGTVSLHGTNVETGLQQFQEIRLVATLDGKRVWINPLQASVASGELIEGTGWFTLEKAYEIALVSKGVSLHNIDTIREQEIADGEVLFNISGHGTVEDPHLTGEVALTNLRFKGKSVEDFQLHLDLHDQELRISGKLNFDINASFNLQTKLFSASFLFDDTDLGPYFKLADRGQLSGTVTGGIEASGNLKAIQHIRGHADLSKLDLFFKGTELIRTRELKMSLADERFVIPGTKLLLLKEGQIEIKGEGKLNGPIALQAEGSIPLPALGLFVAELPDLGGDVFLSAAIGGTWPHLDVQADLELKQASFTVPTLLQKVDNINGKIHITPQEITIDRLEGRVDTGNFSLAGKVALKELRPFDAFVTLKVAALPVRVPDVLDMVLNAELNVQGTPEKSTAQGEAVILEGTYYRDMGLSSLWVFGEKKREEAPLPKEITLPYLKNMSLDISLRGRTPFVVDNNLAHLEISPDLRLSGTVNNPVILGRATAESGTVIFRNKTFVVKRGVIDFSNPYKIESALDIEGETQIRKWTIHLAVSGTPDKLSFELSSEPPEEEGDLLSLLLVGRTTQELIKAEGGSTQSPAQMLAGLVSATYGEDIKKATGLDILELETEGQEEEQVSDHVKVTIGKELSKRMTLKYAVESKEGQMSQRAIAEYKLMENILMSGFQDSEGMFGGELFFRLEFR
jgi:translocation and assembly module TamB